MTTRVVAAACARSSPRTLRVWLVRVDFENIWDLECAYDRACCWNLARVFLLGALLVLYKKFGLRINMPRLEVPVVVFLRFLPLGLFSYFKKSSDLEYKRRCDVVLEGACCGASLFAFGLFFVL